MAKDAHPTYVSNSDPAATETDNGIRTAIIAGSALAGPITNPHEDGDASVLVPPGYSLEYLSRHEFPIRKSGSVRLNDIASFIEYWKQEKQSNSRIYGSIDPGQFLAVFNDYDVGSPDWKDYCAVYKLRHSKEWDTWMKHDRHNFEGNESFAIWLEDNAIDIVEPDPARMMDIALNMRVHQQQGLSNAVRLADGNIQFNYANVVTGDAGVPKDATGGTLKIPETFKIEIPVFEGLESKRYVVEARFRYRLHNSALHVRYELVRPHKVIEQAFRDLVAQIKAETDTTVLFGTPS